jgi:Winged helix-turn-helix DNA-binding
MCTLGATHPHHGGTLIAPTQSDETQLRTLAAEGLSPIEIAKRLGLPRSTVRDRLKKLDLAPPPETTASASTEGTPNVYDGMLEGIMADLRELVGWWQERQATLQQASDTNRKTERTTCHVAQRWIDAIRRQADLDGMTSTRIVNAAFRQYSRASHHDIDGASTPERGQRGAAHWPRSKGRSASGHTSPVELRTTNDPR